MKTFTINTEEVAALREAARIIKGGFEHYPSVHRLERSILEAYSLQTGTDFQKLRKAARRIRLFADIDERAEFYCALISKTIGENISPRLYEKVNNDLILVNSKGDFVKVSEMKKIKVRGDEYAIISKSKGETYLIRMNDPYWYGSLFIYDYCPEKELARKIAHVPMCMIKGF
jgi:hypothetical protein